MAIRKRQLFKVTLISLLAILITVFLFFMVFKVQIITGPYFYIHFEHVGSLTVGAVVRMAGVRIGTVSSIDINEADYTTVIVTVTLYPNQKVRDDSEFIIMSGSLIGDLYIEVLPGQSNEFIADGETFKGESLKSIDAFMMSSETLIQDLTISMGVLSEILRNNQENIEQTLRNVRESTDALNASLAGTPDGAPTLLDKIDTVFTNLEKTTAELNTLLAELNSSDSAISLLNRKETRADLEQTIANLREISENLVGVTEGLETIVGSVVGPAPSPVSYTHLTLPTKRIV